MRKKLGRVAVQHVNIVNEKPGTAFQLTLSDVNLHAEISVLNPSTNTVELRHWNGRDSRRARTAQFQVTAIRKGMELPYTISSKSVIILRIEREHDGATVPEVNHHTKQGCVRLPLQLLPAYLR